MSAPAVLHSRLVHRAAVAIILAATLLLAFPTSASTHEVPASVTVLAFVKPEGERLRLAVRVPLESIRDIDFPLRGASPGYLDIAAADTVLRDAAKIWIADFVSLRENGRTLGAPRIVATRVSLPSDRSFSEYETALAHVEGAPLPADTELPWQQAMLDVLLEYDIASAGARFDIHPAWSHLGLRTTTVLRFLPPDGGERVLRYDGDPGLVHLDPRWHQAALSFVALGFHHILDGIDHLLFVLCLVIPIRRFRPLVAVVTSFTVAHSITLIAAAFGLAPSAGWFPPLIETLIALSIVWMALENIVGPKLERRWMVAFGFGLVHGFGFSFVLRESLQFAGSHLLTSLLAFNVGVELGQIAVIAVAIPVLAFVFRRVVKERIGTIILSALVAHTAWHWMSSRWGTFRAYELTAPAFDLALLASLMRFAMLALVVAGAAWLLWELSRRLGAVPRTDASEVRSGDISR